MPAAGSAPPIWARGCSPPTIPALAAELATRLDGYNRERREIEAQTLEAAIAMVEAAPQSPALVFAAAEGWHPGVIGIVAARLRERYERPACVVALDGGIGKGSGRSVPGVALGPAVIAARQAGLLVNGGGHAMAAGFTVAAERLERCASSSPSGSATGGAASARPPNWRSTARCRRRALSPG